MKPFLSKSQKIIVSCILQKDEKILLFRKNKFFDDFYGADAAYFDIPHFLVDFGQDPKFIIKERFAECFGYDVMITGLVEIRQNITDETSLQLFEIVYKVKCNNITNKEERKDLFFFADKEELDSYVFLQRRKDISSYLEG
jgi:hypothetical protein